MIRLLKLMKAKSFFVGLKLVVVLLLFVVFSFVPLWEPLRSSLGQAAWASAASARVGTIPGEFTVNGNGGANYTIPIEVPPGTNGVQPELSLVYNSQQGNGLLGMGWTLQGLSAIARCPKTIAQDGQIGGVNLDSNDRFCLDGQRLVAVSGSYGANGTEYRTERETWTKVVSHFQRQQNGTYTSCGNGPCYFTATTKDGSQLEFGQTDDSRIEAQGKSTVRVWAINRITDRNGNYVTASYSDAVTRAAFLGYRPTEIKYTGNTGLQPQRLVKFEYEGRNDPITAYVAGSQVQTTKRLSKIKTYVDLDGDGNNVTAGNNLVKEYRLTYEYGSGTKRSRVNKVEECDAAEVCLPATEFRYQNSGSGNSFSKQNLTDYDVMRGDKVNIIPGDFNGDGILDFIRQEKADWDGDDNNTANVYLAQGDGTFTKQDLTQYQIMKGSQVYIIPGDFNGDGVTDFIRQEYGSLANDVSRTLKFI